MTRSKKRKPTPEVVVTHKKTAAAGSAVPPQKLEEEAEEAELQQLALDRLAAAVHPELFMALQESLPAGDPRWVMIFAHAFTESGELSPLLKAAPTSLKPLKFRLESDEGDAAWMVGQLTQAFFRFPVRLEEWRARVSHAAVTALGEERCAALGRGGMSDVVGAVDEALQATLPQVPDRREPLPLALDVAALTHAVDAAFPVALGRVRIGVQLQQAFPREDDEELDALITDATRGLEMRAGPAPEFAVEVRAGDRPWLPLQNVVDALKRKLAGGLRVLRGG